MGWFFVYFKVELCFILFLSPYVRVREMRGHFPNNPRPPFLSACGFIRHITCSGGRPKLASLKHARPFILNRTYTSSIQKGKFGDCFQAPFALSLSKGEHSCFDKLIHMDVMYADIAGANIGQHERCLRHLYSLIRSRASQKYLDKHFGCLSAASFQSAQIV